jgi:tetratricopeptide (TPR) repeat protein
MMNRVVPSKNDVTFNSKETHFYPYQQKPSDADWILAKPGTPTGNSDSAALLASADALRLLYETTWELSVLDQNIDILQKAHRLLELTSSATVKDYLAEDALSWCMVQLASAYDSRYMHTGEAKDLEEQVSCCEAVLAMSGAGQRYEIATRMLSEALRRRFQLMKRPEDITRAVNIQRDLLDRTLQPSAPLLSQMGRNMTSRFEWGGNLTDLDEALSLHEQSLAMHSTRDYELAYMQYCLSHTLSRRYARFGALEDLHRGVQLISDSIALREGHRDLHLSLNLLAIFYTRLCEKSGSLVDLDNSIRLYEKALALQGRLHPTYSMTLSNLASALSLNHFHTGSLQNLDRAISVVRESLTLLPSDHPQRCFSLINLSVALNDRFHVLGNLDDEDEGIALKRKALKIIPPGHWAREQSMNHLALGLAGRYERTRNHEDVVEAMALQEEVLESSSVGSTAHHLALLGLADLLVTKHRFTNSRTDLNRAIALHELWLEQMAHEQLYESTCLHTLANAFVCRFRLLQDDADLSNAIEKFQAALALRPDGDPRRYQTLNDLSVALRLRSRTKGVVDDMETAFEYQMAALDCVPNGHPDRSRVLYGLASLHASEIIPYHDFIISLSYAAEALLDASCSVQSRIQGFLELLPDIVSGASQQADTSKRFFDVLRHALQLLPQMAYIGLYVRERLWMLKHTEHLAAITADLALRLGRANDAVEVLEEGRAVFWTQYLRLRTNFDLLPPHLAEELMRLAGQIEQATHRFKRQESNNDSKNDGATKDATVVANRRLAVQFETLVKNARSLPGFERFLLHEPYSLLTLVAERCPVVVLLASTNCCAALLIRGQGMSTEHVELPGITAEQLQNLGRLMHVTNSEVRATRNGRAMRQSRPEGDGASRTLRALWEHVAKPLIMAIGCPVREYVTSNHGSLLRRRLRTESKWTSTTSPSHMRDRCLQSCAVPCCTCLNT